MFMAVKQAKIDVTVCRCERCGYEWKIKQGKELPLRCARCKTPYWNRPKEGDSHAAD